MRRTVALMAICFGCELLALGPAPARAVELARMRDDQVLMMVHTGGWGAGTLADFQVDKDGHFTYTTRAPRAPRGAEGKTITGTLTPDQITALTKKIADAGAGPAAEDAGYVEFLWRDPDGKQQKRDYSMPRAAPCADLLKAVADLAQMQAKPATTQSGKK